MSAFRESSGAASPGRTAEFAWPGGDQPGPLNFAHDVPPPLLAALERALAQPIAEAALLAPANGPLGRFRIVTSDGGRWFLRVSARWGEPQLERQFASYLSSRGVPVNDLSVAGRRFRWKGEEYRLDLRPLLEGRHFDGSLDDLRRLAGALVGCHEAARRFPASPVIQALAGERYARYEGIAAVMKTHLRNGAWDRFSTDPEWAERHRHWLAEMLSEFAPRFDRLPGAQCLHGQVHRGNVLFLESGQPILLDFEEAVHTFAPSSWDTAHLLQRFCLHDDPPPDVLRPRISVVEEAYDRPLSGLPEMMRQIAWLSIAILVTDHLCPGASSPVAEYDKFIRLETQARGLAGMLPS